MVPYEAFLSAKPVVTTIDAGGPLEVVHDRETGRRRRARAGRARAGVRLPRGHVDEAKAWGQAGKAIAERITWDALHRRACWRREGRLLLAAAAVAVGDRRLLGAAPPALRERVERAGRRRAGQARRRRRTSTLYHVGNDPDSHGWIVDALRRRPGVVVLHEFVLHHLISGITIGRGDGRGYLDAMERELGVAGRLLGARRARQPAAAPLGDPARALPAHRHGARSRRRADRPLALRRGARARGGLRRAALAHPAPGLAGDARSRRRTSTAIRSSAASAT